MNKFYCQAVLTPFPGFAKLFVGMKLLVEPVENTSSVDGPWCDTVDSDFKFKDVFHLTFFQIK